MQYRTLGKTGISVSTLGIGMMRLPMMGGMQGGTRVKGEIDEEASVRMLRRALELGINYIDTAYNYMSGQSEFIVGRALEGGLRDKAVIATKSPVWQIDEPGDFDRMLEEQLRRLKTDSIDLYLLHGLDAAYWQERVLKYGVLDRLQKVRDEGKIRHIGFSFHDDLDTFKMIVDGFDGWEFCQIQLNYLDTEYQAGVSGLRYAAERGLGAVIMEPLRGGYLADLPREVGEIFKRSGKSSICRAFEFLWDMPEVSTVLSGMGTVAEVEENASYADAFAPLDGEDRKVIEEAVKQFASYDTIPCTRCDYCYDCPKKIPIPKVFSAYNYYKTHNDIAKAVKSYKAIPAEKNISACISCGKCERICPQHLKITELFKEVGALLDKNED